MPKYQIVITPELQKALEALTWIIDKSYEKLEGHQLPKKELTNKTRVTLALLTASEDYAEAVGILCKNFKSKAATPICRALLEVRITLAYLLQIDDESRVLAAAAAEAGGTASIAKKLADFVTKHPSIKPNVTASEYQKISDENKSEEQKFIESLKKLVGEDGAKKGFPGLEVRSKMYDEGQATTGEVTSLQYTYLLVFHRLSAGTHLGFDGLKEWFEEDDKGIQLNSTETHYNVHLIAYTAFNLFADILTLSLKQIGLEDTAFTQEVIKKSVDIQPPKNE